VKVAAGSLVAHAALAAVACTTAQNQNTATEATPSSSPSASTAAATGPTQSECCPPGTAGEESHLPPVIIGGYESIRIEIKNQLAAPPGGAAPFVYTEVTKDDIPNPQPPLPDDRYGNLSRVRVITELAIRPFFKEVEYFGLPTGSQLFIWYQPVQGASPPSSGDDCIFTPVPYFPDDDPDLRVKGGSGADPFKLTVKHQRLEARIPTHKCTHPNRYKHKNIPGVGRHFRIGKWRLVDSAGRIVAPGFEGSGDEDYTLYLTFADFA
jgi:hypothetical protein